MKYLLLNDLNYIITKKYKIILIYLSLFLLYFYSMKNFIDFKVMSDILNNIFGFKINLIEKIKSTLDLSFLFVDYGLYFYLSVLIFIKDYDNYDNLFQRLTFTKWIISKLIVSLIICLFLNMMVFLPVYMCHLVEINFLIIILKKIMLIISIIIWIYIIIISFYKNKIISTILLLIVIVVAFIPLNLINIEILNLFIIMSILTIIILIISKYIRFSDLKG